MKPLPKTPLEKLPKSKRPTRRQLFCVGIGFVCIFISCVIIWPQYWFAMLVFFKGVFKKILMGVWHKMLQFFLGLTATQLISIGVKRYFMDHVVSKNMRFFIRHLIEPIKRIWRSFENKLLILLPAPIVGAATAFWFGIDKVIAMFLQKGVIIAFFKWLWTLPIVLWNLLNGRLLRPIMELLAINWLWMKLENRYPVLKSMFLPVYRFLERTLFVVDSKIQKPVKQTLEKSGRKVGGHLENIAEKMEQRKVRNETDVPTILDENSRSE